MDSSEYDVLVLVLVRDETRPDDPPESHGFSEHFWIITSTWMSRIPAKDQRRDHGVWQMTPSFPHIHGHQPNASE